MIPFFRKIRKTLADDNKPIKYLRYAVGEIVLVVIGILIALQINNWNEQSKIETIRQNYYNQILHDLNKDKITIEKSFLLHGSKHNEYNAYLETYKQPNLNLNQVNAILFNLSIVSKSIRFDNNSIHSLNNTGDIKLMPSNIRNKLIDLKQSQDQTIKVSDGNIEKTLDILKLVSVEMGSKTLVPRLVNQPILAELLKIDSKLEKLFILLEAFHEWKDAGEAITLNNLKKILSEEEELINLIQEELKKQ